MSELSKRFIDAVERLAFEMPAPNAYTPRFVQMCNEARNHMAAAPVEPQAVDAGPIIGAPVDWAVSRWHAEVANRPLRNIHRRALDDTWRQVIRHFGGDDVALCGPSHGELIEANHE